MENGVDQELLQFGVHVLEDFRAVGVRNIHADELGLLIERRGAVEAMAAADFSRRPPVPAPARLRRCVSR